MSTKWFFHTSLQKWFQSGGVTLEVALSISGLLTKSLSMEERCEISVSGFCLLDIFSIYADKRCSELRLPTGSLFLAKQTARNLQGVSLASLIITVAKDRHMAPWKHGSVRLAELSIEQFFGELRSQSSTAQLGCRSYWQASARHALKYVKELEAQKPTSPGDLALSDDQ